MDYNFGVISKKSLSNWKQHRFSLSLHFTLRSIFYFALIFIISKDQGLYLGLYFCIWTGNNSCAIFLKWLVFLHLIASAPLSKILTLFVWVSFWVLHSVSLMYTCILLLMQYWLNHCIYSKPWNSVVYVFCLSSKLLFLLSRSFVFHIKARYYKVS